MQHVFAQQIKEGDVRTFEFIPGIDRGRQYLIVAQNGLIVLGAKTLIRRSFHVPDVLIGLQLCSMIPKIPAGVVFLDKKRAHVAAWPGLPFVQSDGAQATTYVGTSKPNSVALKQHAIADHLCDIIVQKVPAALLVVEIVDMKLWMAEAFTTAFSAVFPEAEFVRVGVLPSG